jgi:ABC-type transport system substrate-binding protein
VDTTVTIKFEQAGPKTDVWRAEVITSPDAQVIAMQSEEGHVLTDVIRTKDVEKLRDDGFTLTGDLGFHMGHIGYNIRPDQSYRRDDVSFWPLSDVKFREALFHCYDQTRIVDTIYGYIVRPVQSLIPPAQGNWSNPNIPTYEYNPNAGYTNPGDPIPGDLGDPTASTTILWNAGYRYHGTGYGDTSAYWTYPDTEPVRPDTGDRTLHEYVLWTPTYDVAPTSADHGRMFVDDLAKIGLQANDGNGKRGFVHVPHEFDAYLKMVFGDAAVSPPEPGGDFDSYMVFWSLSRFPDHVYDMCHSSFDSKEYPGENNAPGINDPRVDDYTETIKFSLDHLEKMNAAWYLQVLLYNSSETNADSFALAYMQLYSRVYWNAFNPDLRGIVTSPGYGSDNGYTYLNIRWAPGTEKTLPDGRTQVTWVWGEYPESFNTLYATTVYAVYLISKTQDGLMDVNPYSHADIGAMAEDWMVLETPGGPGAMEITYYLRKDVFWQDGTPYTAWDAKYNWMFLKNNKIPRYTSVWKFIQDVEVIDDYTVTVVSNTTSQFLLYDFAGCAALIPPVVWRALDGEPLATIVSYAPEEHTESLTYTTPLSGYPSDFAMSTGPWFGDGELGHPQTHLYGVGPWIFEYYMGGVAQFGRANHYYQTSVYTQLRLATMFHEIGDVGQGTYPGPWYEPDGVIDVWDISYLSWNYGYFGLGCPSGPLCEIPENVIQADGEYGDSYTATDVGYRDWLDINHDGVIDMWDLSSAGYYQNQQKEYP